MKKVMGAMLAAVILVFGQALRANARDHPGWHHGARGHVFVGTRVFVGTPFWWGPAWWWGPPYPYYVAPPVVVQEAPPVYIQQQPAPPQAAYWYYCPNPGGYYPYITDCPSGWLTVVPPAR